MINKNTPVIRFPGFTGDWEQSKLGEVVNITMGQSPNGENYTENPDDHILVQGNADIKNGWVAPRVWTTQVTKSADKGDIILSVRAPVGDVGKTQYDVVLGRGVAGIKGNEFIFQSLSKMKSNGFWTRYSSGSTFESINSNDLKEAIISIPKEAEQTKIGNFFKQLDDTIALHQQELTTLEQTKQSFLQKMFPKEGGVVPEVRFPGFTDDWEQCKLNEILKERKVNQKISKEVPLLAFAAGQGVIDRSERKTNNRDFLTKDSTEKTYLLTKYDDIVYNPSNLKYGAIDRNKHGQGVISPIYVTFETDEVPSFIEIIVKSDNFKQRALQYEEGTVTKRQSVKPENLLCLNVVLPNSKDEQIKIGNFFKHLDDTSALHHRELDALKETKKAFLQKMFV